MKKHALILGAGFAGLELAAQLSESLRDEVRVTLLDQSDSFSFGFSKLDVMLGRRAAEDLRLYYGDIALEGVEFRQERVTSIDPDQRRVTTDAASYDADVLAIALGADYDFAATPGFQEGGYEYYSIAGAERLRDALPDFDSGTILIGILGHPFKCPPAPFEGALLLHDHFLERGIREAVEIRVIGPMAAPVPVTKELSQAFLDALGERGIEYVPKQLVTSIEDGQARLAGGESVPYDHFIGIPAHRVPEVVESSGLAVDGWVPVNRANLATRFPGVYAMGDVAGLPMAKAGVFAEAAARVAAEDIAAGLRGGEPPPPYEGAGNCYIEFGDGLVGKVEANFLGGPAPTAELVGPSRELAAEKEEFGSIRRARWFGSAP
ncbi:MAG: NAD(P)/FAD-dependent oxidoreductase [Actinobacteria bacterium]|nr:MAG: NAD(P)/FAD-dependent oxidoreductase [Actinomycetota bacterium]